MVHFISYNHFLNQNSFLFKNFIDKDNLYRVLLLLNVFSVYKKMNTKEKIQYLIQNNKLKFFQDIEILYYNDYYKKSLKTIRVALFLAFILYSFFGFLDTFLAPNSKTNIWLIRYGVVCPILIFAIIISYFKLFKKYIY